MQSEMTGTNHDEACFLPYKIIIHLLQDSLHLCTSDATGNETAVTKLKYLVQFCDCAFFI